MQLVLLVGVFLEFVFVVPRVSSFHLNVAESSSSQIRRTSCRIQQRRGGPHHAAGIFDFVGGSPRIPKTPNERNQQVIKAARSALASPRTPSFKLIECEFPAVAALNKLGDGSLRSANEVDDANLATAKAIVQSISSVIPGLGPAVWLLTSTAAGPAFIKKATESTTKVPSYVHNLKEGLPAIKSRDVCVLVAPCNSQDYAAAQRLAINGNAVILVNGFAKDLQSVPGAATMAYFLKPLTYNSQIAGYLIRCYPGPWTVVDAATGSTLSTCLDETILVAGTNTPDLRAAVKLVQRAVDERAIRARALPK